MWAGRLYFASFPFFFVVPRGLICLFPIYSGLPLGVFDG